MYLGSEGTLYATQRLQIRNDGVSKLWAVLRRKEREIEIAEREIASERTSRDAPRAKNHVVTQDASDLKIRAARTCAPCFLAPRARVEGFHDATGYGR